ncbi:hypothetical protein [Massilia sp. BSC265]|uniref:hypothetical protein n=1 Tax=Massilia sp. BSC265 TaxID=1549812 RepID=UPI0004E8B510|nr:hypothetical protein [Massilia sp. BSC265]KFI08044.1 hypothetical protein JN27_06290 [Massilia sp. BSC265]
MRDHSHIYDEHSDICTHCGQPLPMQGRPVLTYGRQGPNRPALVGTILLHLLLVLIWLFNPDKDAKQAKPASGDEGEVVYVAPMKQKPTEAVREQAPKPLPMPSIPVPQQERIEIARLPDTITTPPEAPVKETKPPQKFDQEKPVDMQAFIEARRRQRGAATGSEQPAAEESESAKGMRNALANIAAINGRGREDRNESGGVFSVSNKTFHSMDLKFRGWNPNFQRRWLTQVTVEQGNEPDIEIAVVKKMIELIRREKTGDFEWDSHRLGRIVKLSARPQDTDQLMTFLFKEMFPEYKPPPQWR